MNDACGVESEQALERRPIGEIELRTGTGRRIELAQPRFLSRTS
jgi:hypothetical protein